MPRIRCGVVIPAWRRVDTAHAPARRRPDRADRKQQHGRVLPGSHRAYHAREAPRGIGSSAQGAIAGARSCSICCAGARARPRPPRPCGGVRRRAAPCGCHHTYSQPQPTFTGAPRRALSSMGDPNQLPRRIVKETQRLLSEPGRAQRTLLVRAADTLRILPLNPAPPPSTARNSLHPPALQLRGSQQRHMRTT